VTGEDSNNANRYTQIPKQAGDGDGHDPKKRGAPETA
jgi:hypothetical protein